jgi:LPXTG-motif cell wall-anchored protein
MRNFLPRVALVGACFTLAASAPAWAHVVVSPEEATAGDYVTLTVSVPTEKGVPTTEIRVEVPEGFVLSGVQPVPGWEHAFEEDGGMVTAVTWSGGQIEPREFQQFLVQSRAPEEPGDYPWRATQTYEDGSTVEWIGPPDAEEPASVVEVVSDGSGGHGAGSAATTEATAHGEATTAGTNADALASTGGTSPILYAALGITSLAFGTLLVWRFVRG